MLVVRHLLRTEAVVLRDLPGFHWGCRGSSFVYLGWLSTVHHSSSFGDRWILSFLYSTSTLTSTQLTFFAAHSLTWPSPSVSSQDPGLHPADLLWDGDFSVCRVPVGVFLWPLPQGFVLLSSWLYLLSRLGACFSHYEPVIPSLLPWVSPLSLCLVAVLRLYMDSTPLDPRVWGCGWICGGVLWFTLYQLTRERCSWHMEVAALHNSGLSCIPVYWFV